MRRAVRIVTRAESNAALEYAGGPPQYRDMLALRMPELALSELSRAREWYESEPGRSRRPCVCVELLPLRGIRSQGAKGRHAKAEGVKPKGAAAGMGCLAVSAPVQVCILHKHMAGWGMCVPSPIMAMPSPIDDFCTARLLMRPWCQPKTFQFR